jgi:hypothetical protein
MNWDPTKGIILSPQKGVPWNESLHIFREQIHLSSTNLKKEVLEHIVTQNVERGRGC